jgi:uncharacterized delta-60 repeat protein
MCLVILAIAAGTTAWAEDTARKAPFFGNTRPLAVAIQADGRIIAAGSVEGSGPADTDFAVMRFNLDGTPDATFGAGGRVTTDFGGSNDVATAIAIQDDGKIVVAGTTQVFSLLPPHSTLLVGLARYTTAGGLDPAFGAGGKVTQIVDQSLPPITSYSPTAITIAPNTDIFVAVPSVSRFTGVISDLLQRFTSDGTPLPDWTVGGLSVHSADPLAFGPGGSLLTLGQEGNPLRLARYTPAGVLDPTFGGSGVVHFGQCYVIICGSVAVQPDGKPVVAWDGTLRRFTAGGAPDMTFGQGGAVASAFNSLNQGGSLRAVAVAPNGTIVAAGGTLTGGLDHYGDFGVLVTNSAGLVVERLTTDFDGEDYADAVRVLQDGSIVAAGFSIKGRFGCCPFIDPVYNVAWTQFVPRPLRPLPSSALTTDFDGDLRADVAVVSAVGEWHIRTSTSAFGSREAYRWGASTDIPVAADFDADGRTDLTVYRPSTGVWYVIDPRTLQQAAYQWGASGDVPVPGDYDGDGRTELAVWRPGTGEWFTYNLASGAIGRYQLGAAGDVPIPRDYTGDGRTDLAIYRPSTGVWRVLDVATGTTREYQWGAAGDIPVPGDYTGDLRLDLAIYRPSNGTWWIFDLHTGTYFSSQWGAPGDQPVPGDYIGDRRADLAVWRPGTGEWFIWDLATRTFVVVQPGGTG